MAKFYYDDDFYDDDEMDYSRPHKIKRPIGSAPKQKQYSKNQKQTFRKERQAKQKEHDKSSYQNTEE